MDPYRRTPPLSLAGSREVEEEMARPPADTPERRSLFERVRRRMLMRKAHEATELPWFLDGITVLGEEGSREVLEEIRNGSPDTPERRAMFARMERRAEIRKRLAAEEDVGKLG